ncbi:hypothetical protein [Bradyrhizobium sp. CCGUVB14]|uniref:hypothetical protein n=1 Tax=Bradyrhizobium sp. CCGUVB14 TaxID=2949628 RepID=UPI0020B319F8|nr:hypothetical protein [Bradyrhizobium sp. CCGUVB14]MCP3441979.1 hypothetical protein [Bradyrhizobium sp. CCGUVB14]
MSKAASAKVFTKFNFRLRYDRLDSEQWKQLEAIWGCQLSAATREKIDVVNSLYAAIGNLHAKGKTQTVAKAENALNAWIKASGRLRKNLNAPKTSGVQMSKAEVISRFYGDDAVRKIAEMGPVVFAQYVVDAAVGAALLALDEIKTRNMDVDLKRELWFAWVMYLAGLATDSGAKVTASSANKLKNDSPFVQGILFLQKRLPKECHHYSGYESVAKGVNWAKQKFAKTSPKILLAIIAGWGANIEGFNGSNRGAPAAVLEKLFPGNVAAKKRSRASRVY